MGKVYFALKIDTIFSDIYRRKGEKHERKKNNETNFGDGNGGSIYRVRNYVYAKDS